MKRHESSREGESELALIRRATNGDQAAFHDLICAYEPGLQAYLTKMLGDWDVAQDIVQETFITLFHALPTWHPPVPHKRAANAPARPLYPWLYHIATNRAISHLRKQTVRERVYGYPVSSTREQTSIAQPAEAESSPEERDIARELLAEALRQLSDDDALCLVLHYVNKERYEEIAERLGASRDAVRKRVNRALVTLRKIYSNLDSEVSL